MVLRRAPDTLRPNWQRGFFQQDLLKFLASGTGGGGGTLEGKPDGATSPGRRAEGGSRPGLSAPAVRTTYGPVHSSGHVGRWKCKAVKQRNQTSWTVVWLLNSPFRQMCQNWRAILKVCTPGVWLTQQRWRRISELRELWFFLKKEKDDTSKSKNTDKGN